MNYKKKKLRADLRELMEAKNLTPQSIADKLNVSPQAVNNWLAGKCQPNKVYVPALAEIFNLAEDELFERRN